MSGHECRRCLGTGKEAASCYPTHGTGCSYCGGRGWTHEAAPVYTRDPFWYMAADELEQMKRQHCEAAEHDAQLHAYRDAHEHHRN